MTDNIPKLSWRDRDNIPKLSWSDRDNVPKLSWRDRDNIPKLSWSDRDNFLKLSWSDRENLRRLFTRLPFDDSYHASSEHKSRTVTAFRPVQTKNADPLKKGEEALNPPTSHRHAHVRRIIK